LGGRRRRHGLRRFGRCGCWWLWLWFAAGLTGARYLLFVTTAITSMARGQTEATDVANATAFDNEIVPRLFQAEVRKSAGDEGLTGPLEDHLPAVGRDVATIPHLRAHLVHLTPAVEYIQELLAALCTGTGWDALDVICCEGGWGEERYYEARFIDRSVGRSRNDRITLCSSAESNFEYFEGGKEFGRQHLNSFEIRQDGLDLGRIGQVRVRKEKMCALFRGVQWWKTPIVRLEVFRLVRWFPEYLPEGGIRRLRRDRPGRTACCGRSRNLRVEPLARRPWARRRCGC
jgi:hypothetical protein